MTKGERRELREEFVEKKIQEDPYMTPEMAIKLFNWNMDHPEEIITDSLLSKIKKKILKRRADVGKLVSKNSETRNKELERVLDKEFLGRYSKDIYFKGFWRVYAVNILRGDMTISKIRVRNYLKNNGKLPPQKEDSKIVVPKKTTERDKKAKKIAWERYPQFGYLSEESQKEILDEILKEIEK